MTALARVAQDRATVKDLLVRQLQVTARDGQMELVSGIGFTVRPGEAIAIVGESGSGKSLTARALLDLLPDGVRANGEVRYGGRDVGRLSGRERRRLRGRELALVMQDPFTMLNPVERCGDQIVAALVDDRGRRLDRKARRREAAARLREVGIHDESVADRYPFELSGGMRQRVAIAAAIAERPHVLVADEPTTALDVTTQREILELLGALRAGRRMGLVLITHDLRVAFSVCDRVYVMYAGTVVEAAPAHELASSPRHPYSLGLLLADPPVDRRVSRLVGMPGSVPAPGERPTGCVFAPRCAWARDACAAALPELRTVEPEHATRCVRIDEIAGELLERRSTARAHAAGAVRNTGAESALVVVENVRKVFAGRGRHGRDTVALDGVSLRIGEGESVGLVGESGSGKTTLGRMIVGLERPSTGHLTVAGLELEGGLTRADRGRLHDAAQMAFQDPYSSLNPARTVGATLREALDLARAEGDRRAAVGELLERVGLPHAYAQRRPAQLSGGERQRVAIARTLARRPRLVVCDEVVSALDVSVQAQILNLLIELRQELGFAYLFITHDLAVVRQLTDRIYVMHQGVVVEAGATASVLDQPEHPYTERLVASIPVSLDKAR
jgi:peptide/nickel transport system ATP-binding protein